MEAEGRIRKPTAKGAQYTADLQNKKNAALARIQARQASAKSQKEVDELSSLFSKVNVAQDDSDIDALTSQLKRMGGRRRKTVKRSKKSPRKTRKH
jgi:hypothetical protein